jgi:ComF family protein
MLLTPLLSLLAPHDCVGCGAEGKLLCADCLAGLPAAEPRCYSCQLAVSGWFTCAECTDYSSIWAVHAAVRYDGLAKDVIWKLKFGRARAAAGEIGCILADATAPYSLQDVIVTHVPTATSRVRQRGYDQAALIARAFAARQHLPYSPLLARQGSRKQVGASRTVRSVQLDGAFRPVRQKYIRGAHIILVDDVITTGATLQSAAATLRAAGARRIEALVFAQA